MTTKTLISGPQWIDQAYYDRVYAPVVKAAFQNENNVFLVGTASGLDHFAQEQLSALAEASLDPVAAAARVTVFAKGA